MANQTATIETNHGTIELELFTDDAPETVANFTKLANDGFYDGLVFHRVIPDFMIQGGCPQGTGTGGPGYTFADEINHHKIVRGTIAMANAGPNTNGSQFFIVTAEATPWLDGKHTAVGQVTSGMDVIDEIQSAATDARDRPVEQGGHHPVDVPWLGHPDGVADRDLVASEVGQLAGDAHDVGRGDRPLVGASERGGNVSAGPHASLAGRRHDGAERVDGLRDRHANVGAGERLRGGGEHRDRVGTGLHRALEAPHVGDEHRVAHPRPAPDAREHLAGVRQLRHRVGPDEGRHLDHGQPGVRQQLHELDLRIGRQDPVLVLEAVAWADLDHRRPLPAHSISASAAPACTSCPASTCPAATAPSPGAATASSIFIASSSTSVWPAATRSPGETSTRRTVPGMGAASEPPAGAAAAPSSSSPPRMNAHPRYRAWSPSTSTSGSGSESPKACQTLPSDPATPSGRSGTSRGDHSSSTKLVVARPLRKRG